MTTHAEHYMVDLSKAQHARDAKRAQDVLDAHLKNKDWMATHCAANAASATDFLDSLPKSYKDRVQRFADTLFEGNLKMAENFIRDAEQVDADTPPELRD